MITNILCGCVVVIAVVTVVLIVKINGMNDLLNYYLDSTIDRIDDQCISSAREIVELKKKVDSLDKDAEQREKELQAKVVEEMEKKLETGINNIMSFNPLGGGSR